MSSQSTQLFNIIEMEKESYQNYDKNLGLTMLAFCQLGYHCFVSNCRSCSVQLNILSNVYHLGMWQVVLVTVIHGESFLTSYESLLFHPKLYYYVHEEIFVASGSK